MFRALCSALCHTILIVSVCGTRIRRADREGGQEVIPTARLVDVTQLFAGLDHTTFAGAESASMCCCKKDSSTPFCIFRDWSEHKTVCSQALFSSSYYKYSNKKRAVGDRRCIVDANEFPEAAAALIEGMADEVHHPKVEIAAYPVYQPYLTPVRGQEFQPRLRVYLLRHGQSKWNVLTEHWEGVPDWLMHKLKDAQLTPKGIDQGIASQEFFKKAFEDVAPETVQLAGSLLSRAYDTLVLGTYHLWSSWSDANYTYRIEQVPSFMEFGGQDTSRHSGLLDSSPVRWDESALPEGDVLSEERFPPALFSKHYETDYETDPNGWLTDKPWQVQLNYPRYSKDSRCSNNDEQLDSAIHYMKDVAMSGKKHLIIGSHSNLIRCVMKRIKRRNLFSEDVKVGEKSVEAKWQDSVGGAFNVYRNKIDNGAVLTFDLEVEVEAGSATPVFSNLGLQSPIRGYPYIGDLRIRVVRGERLVAKDASGTSDPYARLSFGGHTEVDSETVWTNLNPEWNFESSFKVVSAMQVIRLSVWDKNIGRSSDFLGDAIIPVFGVVFGVLETKSLSTKINLEHIEHGEVYLELAFRAAEE